MSLTGNTTLQDLSADEKAELERIADLFFEGIGPVFRDPSEPSAHDRRRAMLLIHNYVFEHFGQRSSPLSILREKGYDPYTAEVKPGKLKYCYDMEETTCYDGGCYSPDCDFYYLYIEIVSDQELQSAIEKPDNKMELRSLRFHLRKQYWDQFPDASGGEHVSHGCLYLSHPFQTSFNLCIRFGTY